MIANDEELSVTLERIARFQAQVAHLRQTGSSPANYLASTSGFVGEIDRMQSEVREYLALHPVELDTAPWALRQAGVRLSTVKDDEVRP